LVKPSIDSSRLPDGSIPEIIPLGGVRECLRKVGWTAGGHQARELIKALTQISFAGCVADLWVPTGEADSEGKTRFLQIKGRFSRMSVYAIGEYHLTEEELAQNKFEFDLADIIYIRLDPLEAKLQQLQDRRILDNQYLFSVSPVARRWYELMAAKIFGVVKNNGQFCEIRYSWYIKHHHTLKRYYERFRVVQQMKRVVRDHIESGYLNKVEFRTIKERDQEVDFIMRYYPGPGARDSNIRIQSFIRERRSRKTQHRLLNSPTTLVKPSGPPERLTALSIVTSTHSDLAFELILRFRINPLRATSLVLTRLAAVREQVQAWPFRQVAPRNLAGWMIQAIENNYDLPISYHDAKAKASHQEALQDERDAISACQLCDERGFRHVFSEQYPTGAMRMCGHDPAVEAKYSTSSDALKLPPFDDSSENEKGLAE
jgi:hypothetical protein